MRGTSRFDLGDDSKENVDREGERCCSTAVSGASRLTPAGRGKALTELLDMVEGRDIFDEVDLLAECGMSRCVGMDSEAWGRGRWREDTACLFVAGSREFLSGTGSLP